MTRAEKDQGHGVGYDIVETHSPSTDRIDAI